MNAIAFAPAVYQPFALTKQTQNRIHELIRSPAFRCRGSCAAITQTIVKVASLFFLSIPFLVFDVLYSASCLLYRCCCLPIRRPAPPAQQPAPAEEPQPNPAPAPLAIPAPATPQGAIEVPPMPASPIIERPGSNLALERARVILRRNGRLANDLHLTPTNLIALIDEFPARKAEIAAWAIEWAERRPIRIDPLHPYFEIFQELLSNRNRYGGGDSPENYADYELTNEEYDSRSTKFEYTIYSLMGFQELTRPDVQQLLRKLDNGANILNQNPAYRFGGALSKILIYPTRAVGIFEPRRQGEGIQEYQRRLDRLRQAMDIPDKIHQGIHVPWRGYQLAKYFHELGEFFERSFAAGGYNELCFDARINSMQEFMEKYLSLRDFNPDIKTTSTLEHRVLEHFRVCKNLQIMKSATEQNLNYKMLYHWISQYGNEIPAALLRNVRDLDNRPINEAQRVQINEQLRAFHDRHFRIADFEDYLQRHNQPLRALVPVWDRRERRRILKPQGPVVQRAGAEGWEETLRRGGNWPDAWG